MEKSAYFLLFKLFLITTPLNHSWNVNAARRHNAIFIARVNIRPWMRRGSAWVSAWFAGASLRLGSWPIQIVAPTCRATRAHAAKNRPGRGSSIYGTAGIKTVLLSVGAISQITVARSVRTKPTLSTNRITLLVVVDISNGSVAGTIYYLFFAKIRISANGKIGSAGYPGGISYF